MVKPLTLWKAVGSIFIDIAVISVAWILLPWWIVAGVGLALIIDLIFLINSWGKR